MQLLPIRLHLQVPFWLNTECKLRYTFHLFIRIVFLILVLLVLYFPVLHFHRCSLRVFLVLVLLVFYFSVLHFHRCSFRFTNCTAFTFRNEDYIRNRRRRHTHTHTPGYPPPQPITPVASCVHLQGGYGQRFTILGHGPLGK